MCQRIFGAPTSSCGPVRALISYIIRLRRGELYNLVAVFHSDHYEEGWNAEGSKDVMWQHFKMQVPQVLRMLERIETWRMWVLCDREPVKSWTSGRITLLGDAAHPMLQYLAQGACMATEDAVVLAQKVAASPDDPARAFKAYEQERYLRTGRTQIMARVYGEIYHARGVAAELRAQALGGARRRKITRVLDGSMAGRSSQSSAGSTFASLPNDGLAQAACARGCAAG